MDGGGGGGGRGFRAWGGVVASSRALRVRWRVLGVESGVGSMGSGAGGESKGWSGGGGSGSWDVGEGCSAEELHSQPILRCGNTGGCMCSVAVIK